MAGELGLHVRSEQIEEQIKRQQNANIAQLFNRATLAEKSAAEVRERAANAELKLAKMTSPRAISGPHFAKAVSLLAAHSAKSFWVTVERNDPDAASEQQALGDQLVRLFLASGWKQNNHWSKMDGMKADTEHVPVSDRGCQVVVSNQEAAFGDAVTTILLDAEIDCISAVDYEVKPGHVIVTVGLR